MRIVPKSNKPYKLADVIIMPNLVEFLRSDKSDRSWNRTVTKHGFLKNLILIEEYSLARFVRKLFTRFRSVLKRKHIQV